MTDKLRAAANEALAALLRVQPQVRGAIPVQDVEEAIMALRAALAEQSEDWDRVAALEASLREHMAEIHRLRAALAEPEHAPGCALLQIPSRDCDCWQEDAGPVAWMVYTEDGKSVYVTDNPADIKVEQRALPLYTHPPRREWQGLTDEEILDIALDCYSKNEANMFKLCHAVEAALKEKNGA